MKIVIDSTIPFTEGVFEPYAEVVYKDGPSISADDVRDASALIIRTRTRCDASLLEGSSVKIIATTTVGTDNIDVDYCSDHGIFFRNASGCNAGGVMNYVFSALYGVAARKSVQLPGTTLGIVGLGNVGTRVEETARALGFKTLRCDPPKAEVEWYSNFCCLDDLLRESDIVTLHVPLNASTRGMANAEFFSKMKPGAFFINTSHGAIVNEADLIEAIPRMGAVVIDAWDNEPNINKQLMDVVDIATPHIAGYSLQGKQLGTMMAVRTVARFLGMRELFGFFPATEISEYQAVRLDVHGKHQGQIASIIQYNYPIFTDDFIFRMNADNFSELRSGYQYRKEFCI